MPEFAPIEVPEGPLITPHTPQLTAPQMPPDVGAGIVAAAAKGAEINGRQRRLEEQILRLQLNDQNKDIEHQLAVMRMAQQAGQFERSANERQIYDAARISDMMFKQNWKEQTATDYSDLVQEVHDAGVSPNDPNYWSTILDIEAKHPKSAMTTAGRQLHNMHATDFNKAAASEANAAYAEDRSIKSDIRGLDWHGLTPTTAPFDSPSSWADTVMTDQNGQPIKDPNTGQPVPGKFVYLGKGQAGLQAGLPQYLTLEKGKYENYMDRWNHAQDRLSKIQEQINDPYGQVPKFPIDTTGGTGARPLPMNKSQLVPNQPYTIPGRPGTYTWDGSNLIPVR